MKIETLLPLGKVDPGLRASEQPLNIDAIGTDASLVEALGYDRLVVEETKDDPFVLMTLAARTTTTRSRCRRPRIRSGARRRSSRWPA